MEYSHKGARGTHTGPAERNSIAVMPIKLCVCVRVCVFVCE